MDSNTILLILSFLFNVVLVGERCFKRVKKSDCCGSHVEFNIDDEIVKPTQV